MHKMNRLLVRFTARRTITSQVRADVGRYVLK